MLIVSLIATAATGAELQSIEELDLEALLDLEYDVASRMDLPTREMPGIVTVLTQEELRRAGVRDLLDALELLPSMASAVDVWGVVGVGVRGNWAFEGKLLLLVDGVPINEPLYGTTPLGNRFPLWMIHSIEVIRGPGSALYGGGAGLAVVDVTTVAGHQADDRSVHGQADVSGFVFDYAGLSRATAGASVQAPVGQDGQLALLVTGGTGQRSDQLYTDVYGDSASMDGASLLRPALAEVRMTQGGFHGTLQAESYDTTYVDGYDFVVRRPFDNDFRALSLDTGWKLSLGDDLAVTPRLLAQRMTPWRSVEPPLAGDYYSREWADRITVGADLDAQPSEVLDLLLGAEAGVDVGHIGEEITGWDFATGRHITYSRAAVLGPALARWRPVTLTLGTRADWHSAYGLALSPRVALTRAWTTTHLKLLGSRAFRSPSIEHLRSPVRPEYTYTLEAEAGWRPVQHTYLTVSAFDVTLVDPVFYFYDSVTDEGYANGSRAGTRGAEADLRWQQGGATLSIAAALWVATGTPPVEIAVPGRPTLHAGLPGQKLVARSGVPVGGHLALGGAVTWLGPRWASTATQGDTALYTQLPSATLIDLTVSITDLPVDGVRLQLTARDVLDSNPAYAHPYDAWHAPLPGTGRSFGLSLGMQR